MLDPVGTGPADDDDRGGAGPPVRTPRARRPDRERHGGSSMNGTPDVPARLARRPAFRAGAVAGAATLLNAGTLGRAEAQAVADGSSAPRAGTWRPWLLSSGSQLRPPPPPDGA